MLPSRWIAAAACFLAAALSREARADWNTTGFVTLDARAFVTKQGYAGQSRDDDVSLRAEPEVGWKSDDKEQSLKLRPFYRLDPIDSQRTHYDLRDARYGYTGEHFAVGAGFGTFSWGVLESYRPSDVMNQEDFVESYRGDAKLGQSFVDLAWLDEHWSFHLYSLPFFRPRTFPGVRGRLRFPVNVDVDHPSYETKLGIWQPSGAARLSYTRGGVDVNLGVLSGLSREPRFVAELSTGNVAPRYDLMQHASLDIQWAIGGFVLKAEGYGRLLTSNLLPYGGGDAGVDYTFSSVSEGWDLSFAAEYLEDWRPLNAPVTLFKHDAFLGSRLASDESGSFEVTAGALVDVFDGTTFGRLLASRRFGDSWRVALDANLFLGPSGVLASSLRHDSYGGATLAYYF